MPSVRGSGESLSLFFYFNSKLLSHLLDSVVYQEPEKNLAFIKRASQIVWENINFRGTYKFEKTGKLPKLDDLMATTEGYTPIEKSNLTYRSVLTSARDIFVLLV